MFLCCDNVSSFPADGFSAIRYGHQYPNEQECSNSTFVTTINFDCDSEAKYNTNQPDISSYVSSAMRIPNAECIVSLSLVRTIFEFRQISHSFRLCTTSSTLVLATNSLPWPPVTAASLDLIPRPFLREFIPMHMHGHIKPILIVKSV